MGVLMTIIGAGVLITLVVLGMTVVWQASVRHDMLIRTTKQNPSSDERKQPEEQTNE